VRAVGLDIHRGFCEVAIHEGGESRSAGRVATTPEALGVFASSLGPEDWVAMEVSGNAAEIARIIEPHVARVVVVSPSDTGIRQARAKTDRLDARTLAPDRLGGRLLDRARASRHQRSTHRGRVLALAQQVHAEVGADQSNRVAPQRGGVAAWRRGGVVVVLGRAGRVRQRRVASGTDQREQAALQRALVQLRVVADAKLVQGVEQ